jgi:hypothetical protein
LWVFPDVGANHEKCHQEEVVIPEEYKSHEAVFSEEGAK